ncbi:MAG: DNA repair protein [Candidatus Delongbacteria bacterium]|nr:DNA repair protein [Candidatus Delongbacteria bacterium]
MKLKTTVVLLPDLKIKRSELHKVRGFFSSKYNENNLIHNHDGDKFIHRYPAVQFKTIDNILYIYSFSSDTEDVFKDIFLTDYELDIEGKKYSINEKQIEVKDLELNDSEDYFKYEFYSHWIALNQKNFEEYMKLKFQDEKDAKLKSIIIQNIISVCKFAGYTIQNKLEVKELNLKPVMTNLKGMEILAFKGDFEINFILPDYIGLGKSVSRGFGNVRRVK